jgi:hypothetical protein
MHPLIKSRLKAVDEYLTDSTLPDAVVKSVRGHLQAHRREILAVTSDDAALRFYREELEAAYRCANADSDDELDDDMTTRSDPLCECDDAFCSVKAGRLPTMVEEADDPDDGIAAFRQEHPRPTALIEAQQAKREAEEAALTCLSECRVACEQGRPVPEIQPDSSENGQQAAGD